jgi:hypothetical protein
MSALALKDCVGSLHDNAETYREGREALDQLNTGRVWSHWQKVGAAFAAGRTEAMRIANTNRPTGKKYNQAFGHVLKRERLDSIDSATRNQLLRIAEKLPEIEAWREKLEPTQRLKLNHPSAVWRNWQRTVKGAGNKRSNGGQIIAALTTLVREMRERKPLDDLLAANLSFTSNDLTELAAQINQFAAAWGEHPTRSRQSDQQERQAMSTGCAGGGQSSAARSD